MPKAKEGVEEAALEAPFANDVDAEGAAAGAPKLKEEVAGLGALPPKLKLVPDAAVLANGFVEGFEAQDIVRPFPCMYYPTKWLTAVDGAADPNEKPVVGFGAPDGAGDPLADFLPGSPRILYQIHRRRAAISYAFLVGRCKVSFRWKHTGVWRSLLRELL